MSHRVSAPAGYSVVEELGPRLARVADLDGTARFLKRLSPRMREEPLAQAQLATEIAALRVLPPHVGARYIDSGEDEFGPYLVEGFLEGCDLERLVRTHGPLEEGHVHALLRSGQECLRALHAAHDDDGPLEVLHSDLSPSNLFVLPSGHVRLVDFELGSLRGRPPLVDGHFRGTLHYASPSMVRGNAPTAADDHFALAASMLFALTGRAPRDAHGPQLLLAAGEAPPAVPERVSEALAAPLRALLGGQLHETTSVVG